MDLVLISPEAKPPVARLIEVSKLKFQQEKARKEAAAKSRAARCGFTTKDKGKVQQQKGLPLFGGVLRGSGGRKGGLFSLGFLSGH